MTAARRRWAIGMGLLSSLAVGTTLWFGLTARTAYAELTASRNDLLAARDHLGRSDAERAAESIKSAARHARTGDAAVQGPLWDLAAALPTIGAAPATVRAIASSLDQALAALAPAGDSLGGLDPNTLIRPGGRIDLVALQNAASPLDAALRGVKTAAGTLAAAPALAKSGAGPLPRSVDNAAHELQTQLGNLESTLTNALAVSNTAPTLLGVDRPQRYLVGILNPNEARGVGGFLGTYAIMRADQGRITVESVGSNTEMVSFPAVPIDLGKQFARRYGDDPALISNMNISPHYPDAAKLWLASWKAKTGEALDGAFAADVVALGHLVAATGQTVPLPHGGSMTGQQLTDFAISGIYEKFPAASDVPARKAYQVAVTSAAIKVLTSTPKRQQLAFAAAQALHERRILLWSADKRSERQLIQSGTGGSLRVPDGHTVTFVAINSSGSKLDAFLRRSLTYEVGRCADTENRVQSRVTVRLVNNIPRGMRVPEYMISMAERGPSGPINSTLAQLHLPNGSDILKVEIDGESVGYSTFLEQGRMSIVLPLALPPRTQRTMSVLFSEPKDDGPGLAPPQPLGNDPQTEIIDRTC